MQPVRVPVAKKFSENVLTKKPSQPGQPGQTAAAQKLPEFANPDRKPGLSGFNPDRAGIHHQKPDPGENNAATTGS